MGARLVEGVKEEVAVLLASLKEETVLVSPVVGEVVLASVLYVEENVEDEGGYECVYEELFLWEE